MTTQATIKINGCNTSLSDYIIDPEKELCDIISQFIKIKDITDFRVLTQTIFSQLLQDDDVELFNKLSKITDLGEATLGEKKYDKMIVVKPLCDNEVTFFLCNIKK